MITACYTNITDSGRLIINTIINDGKQAIQYATFYDMNEIPIESSKSHRFQLSDNENEEFEEVLNSARGQVILNNLKNKNTEVQINAFLRLYKNRVKKLSKMAAFVEDIIKEPLIGKNSLNFFSIGLNKKKIFDAFVENGLIKL